MLSVVLSVVAIIIASLSAIYAKRQADATNRQANLAAPPRLTITASDHQYCAYLDHGGGPDLDEVELEAGTSRSIVLRVVEVGSDRPDLFGAKVKIGPLRAGDYRVIVPSYAGAVDEHAGAVDGRITIRATATARGFTWPPFVIWVEIVPFEGY